MPRFRFHDSCGCATDRREPFNPVPLEQKMTDDRIVIHNHIHDADPGAEYWLHQKPDEIGFLPNNDGPPRERRFDEGNRHYVMTFPPGDYEAEDHDDFVHILRAGSERDFVAAVPAGTYSIESDEHGAHLYREPDDEPARQPLGATPLRIGDALALAADHRRGAAPGTTTALTTLQRVTGDQRCGMAERLRAYRGTVALRHPSRA
jgi:hypothetical protein